MTRLDNDARWLINEIAETKRMAAALAKPQLGTSSIESGRIEEYDKDGNLVQIIGEQHDGTHTTNTVGGPVPPEPVAPAITPGIGSVEARWSGKFADNALSPMDFSHVSLHASRVSVFVPSNTTQLATITGELGDAAVVLIDPGEWTFGLVAVSKAGKWSPLSETVTIDVPDFPTPVDIQDELIRFDEVTGGLITETGKIGEKLDQAANDLANHETRLEANEGVVSDLKDNVIPTLESSMDNLRDVQFPAMNQRIADAEAEISETGTQLNNRLDTAFIRVADAEKVSGEAKSAAAAAQSAADEALTTATTQIQQIIARGQNLVRNGDFEAGTQGWITNEFSPVVDGTSRSGSKSLKIGPNPGGNIWPTSDWVPSSTGRTYYAEYWIKRTGTEAPNLGVGFVLQVKTAAGGTASHTVGRIDPSSISTTEFTKVTVTFKPTTANITNIRFAAWVAAGNNVYYVDDFLAVDVTEAQAAIEAAAAAQQKAQDALNAAGSAQDTATNALTMAGTKNAVFYDTTAPTGNGTNKGDLWRRVDASGDVIGEWQWTGTSWEVRMVSSSAISNLDLGKLTAGTAFVAEAVIEKLWAEVIRARKILVDQLVVGQGENLIPWDLSTGDTAAWGHISGYAVGGANPSRQMGAGVADGNHLYMVAPDTITSISNTWRIGSRPYSAPMGSTGWAVEPGEELKASFYVRAGGNYPTGIMPKIAAGLVWYTAAGAYISTTTTTPEPLTWAWTKREAKGKAPATAAYCLIYLRQDAPGGVRMDLPSLYRVKDGGLIATGAITGDHIEANSVAAKIARFLQLEAGQIVSGTIATARLNALEIAAATASFQTVDVKNLFVTTGTMTEAVINKLWADVVMSRKATFNMLAVGDFQNYVATGLGYNNEAIDWAQGLTPDFVDVPPGASVAFKSTVGQGSKSSTASRFDVVPGDEYEFVVWVKANVPNSRIYFEVRDQNGAHAMTSTRIDENDLFYGNASYPVSGAVVPTTWTKWRARMVPKPGVRQAYIATIYFNHTSGTETNAQVSIAGLSVKRRFGGEVIIDGSLKSKQLDVEDLAANQGFIADLTARIVKADMFVGKQFQGGTFTGTVFQTDALAERGVKLSNEGLKVYSPEGDLTLSVTAGQGTDFLGIWGNEVAYIDDVTGAIIYPIIQTDEGPVQTQPEQVGQIDFRGYITGNGLSIAGNALFDGVLIANGEPLQDSHMGTEAPGEWGPIFNKRSLLGTTFTNFVDQHPQVTDATSWLTPLAHGFKANAYTTSGVSGTLSAAGRWVWSGNASGLIDRMMIQQQVEIVNNRGYLITYQAPAVRSTDGKSGQVGAAVLEYTNGTALNINNGSTVSGSRIYIPGTGDYFTPGASIYVVGGQDIPAGTIVLGVKVYVYTGRTMESTDTADARYWGISVTDLGLATKGNTGNVVNLYRRTEGDVSPPPPPPVAEKKRYTKTWNASWWTDFDGSSPNSYFTSRGRAAQGNPPGSAGRQRGVIGFPSVISTLSGADIKKVEVYLYAAHWYYSSGGTLVIGTHAETSKPSSYNSTGYEASVKTQAMGKPEGKWITLPSSTWAGWKSGSRRGIQLYAASDNLKYYGYVTGKSAKLRITYEK